MPAEPLTDDERRVLEVLMQPDRKVADCTSDGIADAIGKTFTPTWRILRGLEKRRPQLAHPDVDEGLEIQFWRVTYDAAEAIEPPP